MRFRIIIFWVLTGIVLFVVAAPIIWVYLTAFKAPEDIFSTELRKLFFFDVTIENYKKLFTMYPFLEDLGNTLIISVVSTVIVMCFAIPAAYSFARWNTGKGHLLFTTISTRMFPGAVAAIPYFLMYRNLGLLDTHIGLILLHVYFNLSFATFLLYGFFKEIPQELEHAALVDGYHRIDIFRKIVLPLARPGIAVTTIFCLLWSWNEFFYGLVFTRLSARPVVVLVSSFWGSLEIQYGPIAAGASILLIPPLLVVIFMQRYIIRGLTFGAVKG